MVFCHTRMLFAHAFWKMANPMVGHMSVYLMFLIVHVCSDILQQVHVKVLQCRSRRYDYENIEKRRAIETFSAERNFPSF